MKYNRFEPSGWKNKDSKIWGKPIKYFAIYLTPQTFNLRGPELAPGSDVKSDKQIDAFVR